MRAAARSGEANAMQQVKRYHHLDVLRSFLMMFGVVLHSCTLGESKVYDAIFYISGLVRMEAFFIISGFVTALIYSRYGAQATIQKRIITIGIPLLFGLLVLNPFTNYLVYIFHNPVVELVEYLLDPRRLPNEGPGVWHLHLWFLFPLIVYSFLTPILVRGLNGLENSIPKIVQLKLKRFDFILICLIVTVSGVCLRLLYFSLLKPYLDNTPVSFIAREILYNLPFFALGVFLFLQKSILSRFQSFRLLSIALAVVLLYVYDHLEKILSGDVIRIAQLCIRAWVAVVLSSFLFYVSSKIIKEENSVVRYFSDASYTVYMLHYFVIYVLANLLLGMSLNQYALSVLVACGTLAVTLMAHHFCVKKNRWLLFLINGKTFK